ncbi:MAG: LysR family transcriptional regulator [Kiritimatiellae bacterium]|nr:LysR family transcriptional regulator [Kiritimatiellia bacterium]
MDLRILRYFLAVADEGNITRAANRLHVSQPALSTQLAALEDELGQKLFARGARGIALTEKGVALQQRAGDLVDLAERIEAEIKSKDSDELAGTVAIGAGETPAFRFVARAADVLHRGNPRLHFSVTSGNGEDIVAHLREGTFDLGVLVGPGRYDGFDYLTLPYTHHWGLAVRKDSPLATKKRISPKDVRGIPLICSRQAMVKEFLAGWFGCPFGKLDVVANYNLIYNAAVFVEAGLGAAVCIDGMIPQEFAERVVFRPFAPALVSDVYLAWRRNAALPPATNALLAAIRAKTT